MIQNIVLSIVVIGMSMFAIGTAFLASEEKQYRYDVSITDEHEV
jgi:multisubunit Na+/H+ antiporter MnhC subunit